MCIVEYFALDLLTVTFPCVESFELNLWARTSQFVQKQLGYTYHGILPPYNASKVSVAFRQSSLASIHFSNDSALSLCLRRSGFAIRESLRGRRVRLVPLLVMCSSDRVVMVFAHSECGISFQLLLFHLPLLYPVAIPILLQQRVIVY